MIVKNERNDAQAAIEIANCRALDLGLGTYGECLCAGPNDCPYAMPFGYAFLCQHPRLNEIMEHSQTRAAGTSRG